jgi:hypothetical protein
MVSIAKELDGGTADSAGPPSTSVDPKLTAARADVHRVTWFADVPSHEIGREPEQTDELTVAELARSSLRVKPRQEQRLTFVDIADARANSLIQEQGSNGQRAEAGRASTAKNFVPVDALIEQIGTQCSKPSGPRASAS